VRFTVATRIRSTTSSASLELKATQEKRLGVRLQSASVSPLKKWKKARDSEQEQAVREKINTRQ